MRANRLLAEERQREEKGAVAGEEEVQASKVPRRNSCPDDDRQTDARFTLPWYWATRAVSCVFCRVACPIRSVGCGVAPSFLPSRRPRASGDRACEAARPGRCCLRGGQAPCSPTLSNPPQPPAGLLGQPGHPVRRAASQSLFPLSSCTHFSLSTTITAAVKGQRRVFQARTRPGGGLGRRGTWVHGCRKCRHLPQAGAWAGASRARPRALPLAVLPLEAYSFSGAELIKWTDRSTQSRPAVWSHAHAEGRIKPDLKSVLACFSGHPLLRRPARACREWSASIVLC